ncbi:MAG TPA: hypothetical protein VHO48_13160 [Anaerolineaceae bacterium]|nr:hypothetical protein [Anaerolineaceae bacterium]
MNQNRQATIVVVSRQNRRRESLRSLLKVLPQVEAVYGTQDQGTGQCLVDYYQPEVALFDGFQELNEVKAFLHRVRNSSPRTHCIVISNHPQTEDELSVDGADCILYDGFQASKLLEAVEELLKR